MDLLTQLRVPDARKMNSTNIRSLLFLLIILISIHQVTGQDMKDNRPPLQYTVNIKDKPLVELLDYLQNELSLPIAYAVDNLPEDITVSVSVVKAPMEKLMAQICRHPQLYCIHTQGFYVIRSHLDPVAMALVQEQPPSEETIPTHTLSRSTHREKATEAFMQPIKRLPLRSEAKPPVIEICQVSHHKYLPLGEQIQKSKMALGLLYALDYYQFHFREGMTSEQKYATPQNQSLGMELMFSPIHKRYLLSLGMIYTQRDFEYSYNYHVLDLRDPIPIPDQTIIHTTYMECPLEAGIMVLDKRYAQLSIALGYKASFPVHAEESTTYQNADPQHTEFYLIESPKPMSAASLSINMDYPLNDKIHIFLSPHYVQFFQPINEVAMKSATQALSIQSKIFIIL